MKKLHNIIKVDETKLGKFVGEFREEFNEEFVAEHFEEIFGYDVDITSFEDGFAVAFGMLSDCIISRFEEEVDEQEEDGDV